MHYKQALVIQRFITSFQLYLSAHRNGYALVPKKCAGLMMSQISGAVEAKVGVYRNSAFGRRFLTSKNFDFGFSKIDLKLRKL